MMTEESWRDVAGYEGIYQVSDHGRVRGLDRLASDGRKVHSRILSQTDNGKGYPTVHLHDAHGEPRRAPVHRLVATAFVANPERKEQVNHIDGDCWNASAANLEWVTRSENHIHAYAVLGRAANRPRKGRTACQSIIGVRGKDVLRFESMQAAGRSGFSQASISKCINGRRASHKGYVWSVT